MIRTYIFDCKEINILYKENSSTVTVLMKSSAISDWIPKCSKNIYTDIETGRKYFLFEFNRIYLDSFISEVPELAEMTYKLESEIDKNVI